MPQRNTPSFGGLAALPGARFAVCNGKLHITCPFCGKEDIALVGNHISFMAKMDGKNLLAEDIQLSGVICTAGHLFFIRDRDVITVPLSEA